MLRLGLTGGIGAGKSTIATRLVERGAVLVDADAVAREVVAPGAAGLAEVIEAFGAGVVGADGGLDRPAMAAIVFDDATARQRLNAIVHPRVRARTEELVAAAPDDSVLVQDIPLLVEGAMAAAFHLVVVVDAPEAERIRRLVNDRGMTADEARARIRAQADEAARRAAADVWLDNSGDRTLVPAVVDELWRERLAPFERNLRLGRPPPAAPPRLVPPNPEWPGQFERVAARIRRAAGDGGGVDHIGSTSVPGLAAKDVIDIQLSVPSLEVADELRPALLHAGFVARPEFDHDSPKADEPDPNRWAKRLYQSADPGRAVNLHVRTVGSPGWRFALLLRDWLRADAGARSDYLALKRRVAAAHTDDTDHRGYAAAKEPWFEEAYRSGYRWAAETGWSPTG